MTFQLAPPVPQYPLADKGPQLYHTLIENLQCDSRRAQCGGVQRHSLRRGKLHTASHDHDRSLGVCRPGPPCRSTGAASAPATSTPCAFRCCAAAPLLTPTYAHVATGDDRQPVDGPEILRRCRPARQSAAPQRQAGTGLHHRRSRRRCARSGSEPARRRLFTTRSRSAARGR